MFYSYYTGIVDPGFLLSTNKFPEPGRGSSVKVMLYFSQFHKAMR